MGITLIFAAVASVIAVCVGLVVGRHRGPTFGVAAGVGVLAIGMVGYIGLVVATSSM